MRLSCLAAAVVAAMTRACSSLPRENRPGGTACWGPKTRTTGRALPGDGAYWQGLQDIRRVVDRRTRALSRDLAAQRDADALHDPPRGHLAAWPRTRSPS